MPPDVHAGAPARLRWADVAKGACILLVVLHHVITKQFDPQVPAELDAVSDGWWWLTMTLKPVRMPLFFLLSGFFAASAVRRPWPQVSRRVWSPAYVYVVWLVLLGLFFSVERDLPMNRTQDLPDLAFDLLFASTGLWFLYALAVYFLLTRALAPVPTRWALAGAFTLAACASLLPIDEANRISVLAHFGYFFIGARLPDLVRKVAQRRLPGLLPALTVGLVAGTVTLDQLPLPFSLEVVLLSAFGLPWGILLAVRAAEAPRTAALLSWIGRRTLPIYVMHVALLGVVHHLGVNPALVSGPAALPVALVYPLVIAAVVVAASLALHALLQWCGLGVLFSLPRRRAPEVVAPGRRRSAVSAR